MKPIDIHELQLDYFDLPLDNGEMWADGTILNSLGSLAIELTKRMNELEPDYRNYIFLRVPIEV